MTLGYYTHTTCRTPIRIIPACTQFTCPECGLLVGVDAIIFRRLR